MIPAAKLKQNLDFNKSLGGIIEALKVGASIQLRQFQDKKPLNEEFLASFRECLAMLRHTGQVNHIFLKGRQKLPRCVVGITSDEGFLGELNTLIVNALIDFRKSEKDTVIVLGERGSGYLEDVGIPHVARKGISGEYGLKEIQNLKNHLINEYRKGKFSEVLVIYPKFISVTTQTIDNIRLLPCEFKLNNKEAQGQSQTNEEELSFLFEDIMVMPNTYRVIEGLVDLWIGYVLSHVFYSSKLSELSARLMHLDGSEQELSQRNQKLSLEYFRHVHMLADKTIREISASRFLRKK